MTAMTFFKSTTPPLLKRCLVVSFSVFILCSCASLPESSNENIAPVTNVDTASATSVSPEQILLDIQDEYESSLLPTNQKKYIRNKKLIQLADQYSSKDKCDASHIIIYRLESDYLASDLAQQANIIKAECALQEELLSPQALSKIENWLYEAAQLSSERWQTRTIKALAHTKAKQGLFFDALNTLASNNVLNEYIEDAINKDIVWDWFAACTNDQRERLRNLHSDLRDHYTIMSFILDDSLNDTNRQLNIKRWLDIHSETAVANNVPSQVSHYIEITSKTSQTTAVLLPLSGRLSNQGLAIKNGILSAYLNHHATDNTSIKLEFIDTGSEPQLSQSVFNYPLEEFDTVIGPLLKTHVEQISFHPEQKVLLLNQINSDTENATSIIASFALSPEQEAESLAELMFEQNIQNPIIIKGNTSSARRMGQAFELKWQELSDIASNKGQSNAKHVNPSPVSVSYEDNKSMRIGIRSALDVLQSQRRIRQLSNLNTQQVISVTRNRRDIDAFVVFARPDELELINPIIESSISLFSEKQLPVFATSYSYDHKQSKNSQRDLRNLIFIDMPWLTPDARSDDYSIEIDGLFNQPTSSFLRLFAFGYDAMMLSDNIVQLSVFSTMGLQGLSGTLKVNSSQQVVRELSAIDINRYAETD